MGSRSTIIEPLGVLIATGCKVTVTHFRVYHTEMESLYHAIIAVSSHMIEITRIQVIFETEK